MNEEYTNRMIAIINNMRFWNIMDGSETEKSLRGINKAEETYKKACEDVLVKSLARFFIKSVKDKHFDIKEFKKTMANLRTNINDEEMSQRIFYRAYSEHINEIFGNNVIHASSLCRALQEEGMKEGTEVSESTRKLLSEYFKKEAKKPDFNLAEFRFYLDRYVAHLTSKTAWEDAIHSAFTQVSVDVLCQPSGLKIYEELHRFGMPNPGKYPHERYGKYDIRGYIDDHYKEDRCGILTDDSFKTFKKTLSIFPKISGYENVLDEVYKGKGVRGSMHRILENLNVSGIKIYHALVEAGMKRRNQQEAVAIWSLVEKHCETDDYPGDKNARIEYRQCIQALLEKGLPEEYEIPGVPSKEKKGSLLYEAMCGVLASRGEDKKGYHDISEEIKLLDLIAKYDTNLNYKFSKTESHGLGQGSRAESYGIKEGSSLLFGIIDSQKGEFFVRKPVIEWLVKKFEEAGIDYLSEVDNQGRDIFKKLDLLETSLKNKPPFVKTNTKKWITSFRKFLQKRKNNPSGSVKGISKNSGRFKEAVERKKEERQENIK